MVLHFFKSSSLGLEVRNSVRINSALDLLAIGRGCGTSPWGAPQPSHNIFWGFLSHFFCIFCIHDIAFIAIIAFMSSILLYSSHAETFCPFHPWAQTHSRRTLHEPSQNYTDSLNNYTSYINIHLPPREIHICHLRLVMQLAAMSKTDNVLTPSRETYLSVFDSL